MLCRRTGKPGPGYMKVIQNKPGRAAWEQSGADVGLRRTLIPSAPGRGHPCPTSLFLQLALSPHWPANLDPIHLSPWPGSHITARPGSYNVPTAAPALWWDRDLGDLPQPSLTPLHCSGGGISEPQRGKPGGF